MTSRDLLMTRGTDINSGDTIWKETPLTRAAKNGTWIILDGIDKLRSDTLSSLALLLEQDIINLPDGNRLYAANNFRCIGIAHPVNNNNNRSSWITPEIKSMFHWIEVTPLPSDELRSILVTLYPSLDSKALDRLLQLQKELDKVVLDDNSTEKESLQLTLRKMKHICRRLEQRGRISELGKIVHNTLMTSYLPDREKRIVEKCMSRCGIVAESTTSNYNLGGFDTSYTLDEDLVASCRRTPSNPLLVPNPRFEENPGQAQVMQDILEAHSV